MVVCLLVVWFWFVGGVLQVSGVLYAYCFDFGVCDLWI